MLIQLMGGKRADLITKSVTANGTYYASNYDADGFSSFTVAVPGPSGVLNIMTNGVKDVSAFASVSVEVPNGTETKTVTTNGTYTPTSPNIGFSSFTVAVPNGTETKTATTNGTYTPTAPNIGFSSFTVNVPEPTGTLNITTNGTKNVSSYAYVSVAVPSSGGAVINELSITPTTSAQTITAPTGVDGYSPINVGAVTSAIDENIVAGNIKSGVTILGVTGNITPLNGKTITINPSTSAQTVTPESPYNGFTQVDVPAVANVSAGNIKSGVTILGVTGSVVEKVATHIGTSLRTTSTTRIDPPEGYNCLSYVTVTAYNENRTVTPSTSTQTLSVNSGYSGNGTVTVNPVTSAIDANIQAGNIKNGVTILGVTGTATLAPDYYIQKDNDSGTLKNTSSNVINMSNIRYLDRGVLAYAYYYASNITTFSAPVLTTITGENAMFRAFAASSLTTLSMPSLTTISGGSACKEMCMSCSSLTSVDLSALTTISASNACSSMFAYCSNLTTVNLNNLTTISALSSGCYMMFDHCTSLSSISLNNLTTIANHGCEYMFQHCTSLTSMSFNKLETIDDQGCYYMFVSCTSLTSLSFPALKSTSFGAGTHQFRYMLVGVTGCTVHFPSNLQAVIGSWPDVQSGFDGTNTTVLFDLPATT